MSNQFNINLNDLVRYAALTLIAQQMLLGAMSRADLESTIGNGNEWENIDFLGRTFQVSPGVDAKLHFG